VPLPSAAHISNFDPTSIYACTLLVRIPLALLQDGSHVHGETIGKLGYGSTPVDMVRYVHATDSKEYLLVTINSRGATRVAFADIDQAAPMPVNVPHKIGPAGVPQYPIPLTGAPMTTFPCGLISAELSSNA
jgi:hypothetical protein